MKRMVLTLMLAVVLTATTFAFLPQSSNSNALVQEDAQEHEGMHRPHFAPGEGTIPTAEAASNLQEVHHLEIHADDQFNPANGVRLGNGSLADPYIISGYYVTGDLYIADTDACFIIKENFVNGQLSLNWNAQCVYVHHNYIRDLRVNENIMRTGDTTGGIIENNKISYVGQIRHYDGEFRYNEVGPYAAADVWDEVLETVPFFGVNDPRAINVDGFNQAHFHHNTIYGSVDLDLHGHHHGSAFNASHSHYHGSDESRKMPHDHSQRYNVLWFTDNTIIDPEGYGLRYDDRNHAGDDRTARSEDEMSLNDPHQHHTRIDISRNVIQGAPLWVDIFNADDNMHYERNPGTLTIHDNTVEMIDRSDDQTGPFYLGPEVVPNVGIWVSQGKEMDLSIQGNTVTFEGAPDDVEIPLLNQWYYERYPEAGIYVEQMHDANVTIRDNHAEGFEYGIYAQDMDEMVTWSLFDNTFEGVIMEIYYDNSVANEPATE